MGRRPANLTRLGATALALAISAGATPADPPPVRPRGSLLRWLRESPAEPAGKAMVDARPVDPVTLLPISPDTVEQRPAVAPSDQESAADGIPARSIQFRRSDGAIIRSVVYDDLRRDDNAAAPPQPEIVPPLPVNPPPQIAAPVGPSAPIESPVPESAVPSLPSTPTTDQLPPLPVLPDPPRLVPPEPPAAPLPAPLIPTPVESATPATDFAAPQANAAPALPMGFTPWWGSLVVTQLRDSEGTLPVGVDTMVCQALSHSPHVAALQTDPEIRRTQIVQEQARFDWKTFIETRYDDISDPVGNTLTTGGPDRLKNQKWSTSSGVRRQTTTGGEFEAAQKLGWEDSNSRFFLPSPQRTARLQLSYTQPLLQGAGRAYNESRVVLAEINTHASLDEVSAELQDHLLKVATTYWDLYRARSVYLQRLKFLDSAEQIFETLEARQEIDALRQQILRAKAAVASRRTTLVRANADIRNAESRLKLLVNHPSLLDSDGWELIPCELPRIDYIPLDKTDSANVAMMFRPDIARATKEIRAAGVRLGVAENELLPKLDVILSSYLYGLDGENLPEAFAGQYDAGRPSFAAGLKFEMPIGNRAALSRQDQRQWELSRAMHEYRAAVQTAMTDVDLAVREVETSYLELVSRWEAMGAAHQEADYLKERWLWLGGSDRAAANLLEELMLAQERLVDEEEAFVSAQVRYVVSLSEARRAMGTLMQCVPGGHDFPAMPTHVATPSVVEPASPQPLPSIFEPAPSPSLDAGSDLPPLPQEPAPSAPEAI